METFAAKAENVEVNVTAKPVNETWRNDAETVAATGSFHIHFLMIVYPIIFLFGMFGNTLVIIVILK